MVFAGPEVALSGSAEAASAHASGAATCRTFVTVLQLLMGVLVPTLALHWLRVPGGSGSSLQRPQQARSSAGSSTMGSRRLGWRGQTSTCMAWLGGAAADAEKWLHHLLGLLSGAECDSPLLTAVVWWLTLSGMAILAIALEHGVTVGADGY